MLKRRVKTEAEAKIGKVETGRQSLNSEGWMGKPNERLMSGTEEILESDENRGAHSGL